MKKKGIVAIVVLCVLFFLVGIFILCMLFQKMFSKTLEPGLYNRNNNLIYSWDDLLNDGYFVVENGVLNGNYSSIKELEGSIVLPNDIKEIGTRSFYYCEKIYYVQLPKGLEKIGFNAFAGSGIEKVEIPNTVTIIDSDAFSGCINLKKVDIPKSVTIIDTNAFYGCKNMEQVHLSDGLVEIGDDAFSKTNIKEIFIPKTVEKIGIRIVAYTNIERIVVDEKNREYSSYNKSNIISTKNGTIISGCKNSAIPNSIHTIGEWAFTGTDIERIDLSDTKISKIEEYAFYDCEKLENIVLPKELVVIPAYCFYNCKNLKEVRIGNSVTKIETLAFGNTSLSSVVIPASVKSIDLLSFGEAENLTNLLFEDPNNWYIDGDGHFENEDIDVTDMNAVIQKLLSEGTIYNEVVTSWGDVAYYPKVLKKK